MRQAYSRRLGETLMNESLIATQHIWKRLKTCKFKARSIMFCLLILAAWKAQPPTLAQAAPGEAVNDPQTLLEGLFRPGQMLKIEGQTLFVEKIAGGKLVLAPPAPPTARLGAFITPVDATASSSQEGRVARKMIDGSGWGESARDAREDNAHRR
jgi:hypothetical protein